MTNMNDVIKNEVCPKCGLTNTDYEELQQRNDQSIIVMLWFCYDCKCAWDTEYNFARRFTIREGDE
jgi:hypothetical protein